MALPSVSSVFSQWHRWFDPAGLAKFDEVVRRGELEVVYENEMVKVYQVREQV